MLHVSTQKLIEKLLEQTLNGAIDWKEGDDETVLLETEGYIVELKGAPAQLRLSQENGRELELVDQDSLSSVKFDDARTYADLIREMTNEAGRHAKGTEAAISTILGAVDAGVLKPKPAMPVSRPVTQKIASTEETVEVIEEVSSVEATTEDVVVAETVETQETAPEEPQIDVPPPIDVSAPSEEQTDATPETVETVSDTTHQDDATFTFSAPAESTVTPIEGEQEMSEAVGKLVEEINGEEATTDTAETPVETQPTTSETEWVAEGVQSAPVEQETAPVAEQHTAEAVNEQPTITTYETVETPPQAEPAVEQQPVLHQPTPPEQPTQTQQQESVGFYTPPLSGAAQQSTDSIVQQTEKLRTTPSPFSKVTATGIAVGNGVGTLISGVPQDVQAKTEQHASEVSAAENEAKAQDEQTAENTQQPAPQTDPYKSWS